VRSDLNVFPPHLEESQSVSSDPQLEVPTVRLTKVRATATVAIYAEKLTTVEIKTPSTLLKEGREAPLWSQSWNCLQLSPSSGRKCVELRILASTLKDVYKGVTDESAFALMGREAALLTPR